MAPSAAAQRARAARLEKLKEKLSALSYGTEGQDPYKLFSRCASPHSAAPASPIVLLP